jgi:hypothetical protein
MNKPAASITPFQDRAGNRIVAWKSTAGDVIMHICFTL